MAREIIATPNAPKAIGTYSQATRHGQVVYLSGQIALDPQRGELVGDDIDAQLHQVFRNLRALAEAAGSGLDGVLKLTVYLTDMAHFPRVNAIMAEYFQQPYPARAAVGVAALPRGAKVEMDAIIGL